jgi:serpin B
VIALSLVLTSLLPSPGLAATDRQAAIAGNTEFALDLYRRNGAASRRQLLRFSLQHLAAMAMLHAGARGESAKEIETAMRFPFTGSRLTKAWSAIHAEMKKEGPGSSSCRPTHSGRRVMSGFAAST